MRVLIAEHQPKVRFALRVMLERQPGLSNVSEVADAGELLSQAEHMRPDLVLFDWELADMDAKKTLDALRKLRPRLFVIALSGKDEARDAALQAGADAFVSKADSPDQLFAVLHQYWDRGNDKSKGVQS